MLRPLPLRQHCTCGVDAYLDTASPPQHHNLLCQTLKQIRRYHNLQFIRQAKNILAPSPRSTEMTASPHIDETAESLPQGWDRKANNAGRTYYIDHNTRSTTWMSPQVSNGHSLFTQKNRFTKLIPLLYSSSQHLKSLWT